MRKILVLISLFLILIFSGCTELKKIEKPCLDSSDVGWYLHSSFYETDSEASQIKQLEELCDKAKNTNYPLKEMKTKDLTQGELHGSFLLIGGSVYASIEQKMYIVLTYYDNFSESYKIKKFELEKTDIVTIPKNETPYFSVNKIGLDKEEYDESNHSKIDFYPVDVKLYLPDGWTILDI